MIKFENTEQSVSLEDFNQFEEDLNISLPESYRQHIIQNNGGIPSLPYFRGIGIDYFHSIKYGGEDSLESTLDDILDVLPPDFIPFAYDEGGNQIGFSLLEENYGQVYIWYHDVEEGENLVFLSDSFTDFIKILTEEPQDF